MLLQPKYYSNKNSCWKYKKRLLFVEIWYFSRGLNAENSNAKIAGFCSVTYTFISVRYLQVRYLLVRSFSFIPWITFLCCFNICLFQWFLENKVLNQVIKVFSNKSRSNAISFFIIFNRMSLDRAAFYYLMVLLH